MLSSASCKINSPTFQDDDALKTARLDNVTSAMDEGESFVNHLIIASRAVYVINRLL
jgi:hypothetical protein